MERLRGPWVAGIIGFTLYPKSIPSVAIILLCLRGRVFLGISLPTRFRNVGHNISRKCMYVGKSYEPIHIEHLVKIGMGKSYSCSTHAEWDKAFNNYA